MKFICFGWVDPAKVAAMSQDACDAHINQCFDYDDLLRTDGHILAGQALQPATTARSLRPRDGRLLVTDGPFAETKEFIGGILILEARDIDQAAELMSRHPGLQVCSIEIRPAMEMWPDSRPGLNALNLK